MSEKIIKGKEHRVNSGKPGPRTADERRALYRQFKQLSLIKPRMTDLDIALETGVSDKTVRRWRHREDVSDFLGRPTPTNETETST